jgi:hypothetical protein
LGERKDQKNKPRFHTDPGNQNEALGWAKADFDDSAWNEMTLPTIWEKSQETGQDLIDLDGAVWFRTAVEIPAEAAGKTVTLSLGTIDDFDTTYFNGEKMEVCRRTQLERLCPQKRRPQTEAAWTDEIAVRAGTSLQWHDCSRGPVCGAGRYLVSGRIQRP